jgi:hypothetical protein
VSAKVHFADSEWDSVVQAPTLAAVAVTAADVGGLWAAVKEGAGLARSLAEAKQSTAPGSLLQEICATLETSDGRRIAQDGVKELLRGKHPAEAAEAAVARVGEIASLVAAKAPAESPAFNDFLRATAQRVAEAAKEGTFLGFGGEKVSEAEKKTLADLDHVLG